MTYLRTDDPSSQRPKISPGRLREIQEEAERLQWLLASLLVLPGVLDNEVGKAFAQFLGTVLERSRDATDITLAYGRWFRALMTTGQSWGDYLLDRLVTVDAVLAPVLKGKTIEQLPKATIAAIDHDLRAFQQLWQFEPALACQWAQELAGGAIELVAWSGPSADSEMELDSLDASDPLDVSDQLDKPDHKPDQLTAPDPDQLDKPDQSDASDQSNESDQSDVSDQSAVTEPETKPETKPNPKAALRAQLRNLDDWATATPALVRYLAAADRGQFSESRAFRWRSGQLVPVTHPDPIDLPDLAGYDGPKAQLIQNTEFLLAGHRALNVLLYGARGTGKSSLVKALLSAYGDRGLRLVEVAKQELDHLPEIVDLLRSAPQKFILFVDDLSFEEDDEAFKALKVCLEGGITERPKNVVVYATSNRRHLVREYFADRPRPSDADEVQSWDTVQEKLSFADRFGLTLTFEAADQDTYLEIVNHLADLANLGIDRAELRFRALQWATRHNGRSGRTARQFIDFLTAEQALAAKAAPSTETSEASETSEA
ncbi:MAG: ATP-binding protein [Limnothrix sp.]|nr:ATP-binding protein [Limnothrix sp.]